ncbi:MAG: hypothetical protein J6M06_04580 [Synergistaceae bacterium]|nr:hypothetical protein [Synergistaceae bacterium]
MDRDTWVLGAAVTGFFIAVLLAFSSMYTVEQGERGVVLRWGKLSEVVDAGLHFKMPLVDSVKYMSVRTQKSKLKLEIYSKDIQGATVEVSVNYALSPAAVGNVYTVGGLDYADRYVMPQLMAKPKDIFGKYNAVHIVQNREKIAAEIMKELEASFKEGGVIIQSVQLENIDFSKAYEDSVEERMKAEVEVQKVQQNLERERINAEMLRAKAKGEADARLLQATAQAEAISKIGEAEARAIRAKSEAMRENPNYIQMLQAERWDGKLPQSVIPNAAIPILK